MGRIDRILKAVEATPWAIQPEKLEQIVAILIARAEQGAFPDAEEVERIEARQRSSVETRGAVAVIPVIGTISRRMGMLDAMSGGASIETFQRSFREAMADESVASILLDVDSPGGSVYGVEEAARMIFDARGKKRVVAVADQLMASAAYYLGAAAEELVVTPSGEAGSIGVYMVHFDWSAALEGEGIRPTIIKAGENKAEGNPWEPLPEEARAHFQSLIDDYYADFVRSVARGRGVPVGEVEQKFGQGRTFTARRAVERGMADRTATVEQVIEDLMRGRKASRSRAAVVAPAEIAAGSDEASHEWAAAKGLASAVRGRSPFAAVRETECELEAAEAGLLSRCIEGATERIQAALLEERKTTKATERGAAEGHVATGSRDAPTEPAPEAREESMSDKDTAAQTEGAAIASDAETLIAKERERARQIRELCRAHDVAEAKAEKWVGDGLTVDQVRGLVLEDLRARQSAAPDVRVGSDRELEKPFASLGHQLLAIVDAAKRPDRVDRRLLSLNERFEKLNPMAAASGASTTVPSEGGFIIQPDFARGIIGKMWDEGRVLSRTNPVPLGEGSNALVRNHLKEHSRKTGSRYGGVRVFRAAEADTVTASNPKLRRQRIELEKLMGIFYATEETLQDAVALAVEAERGFRSELTFVAENEIFRGSGAGECLGFLNSNALVTQAAEGGQAAGTVVVENVARMMSRLPPRSFPTAVWYIHSTVIPELILMKVGDTPVFLPGGTVAGARFGTLFGIPIEPVEYCAVLGSLGDILLVDLQQYTTIDKRAAEWAESIHVRFIWDESTFRLTYRFNGQPDWDEAVEEFQGTDKLSPFIALAAR